MSKKACSPGLIMRSEKLCGCGLHRSPETALTDSNVVRAHLVQALVRQRDDLVLPHPGPEGFGDVGVRTVDHGGRGRQQGDLVLGLELPGVQHHLLAVPDVDLLFLQLEEGGDLGEVDADGLVSYAGLRQAVLDLGDLPGGEPGRGRGGAAHRGVGGDAVLRLEPRTVQPVVHGGRAEVPQHQFAGPGVQRVPAQLVPGPLADRDAGQIPDVVVVKDEQRTEARLLHRLLRTVQAVAAEPGEVDPFLEVDVHPARRRGEGTIRHAGLLGSCTSARAPQSKDLCSVAVKPARSWCAV